MLYRLVESTCRPHLYLQFRYKILDYDVAILKLTFIAFKVYYQKKKIL